MNRRAGAPSMTSWSSATVRFRISRGWIRPSKIHGFRVIVPSAKLRPIMLRVGRIQAENGPTAFTVVTRTVPECLLARNGLPNTNLQIHTRMTCGRT